MTRILALLALFLSCSPAIRPAVAQSTIFVDQAAIVGGSGTSWINAFTSLQDALVAAAHGDTIWIAAGTYRPDEGSGISPGDPSVSFQVPGGVTLVGGFAGTEVSLEDRLPGANETILSGDLLGNDNRVVAEQSDLRADNSNNVVLVTGTGGAPVTIDTITIKSGHAVSLATKGGGGIFVDESSAAIVRNAYFTDNYARACGGAISSEGSLVISASAFEDNASAELTWLCRQAASGGAVASLSESEILDISDSFFYRNHGNIGCGGAVAVVFGTAHIRSSTFYDNRAEAGGALCTIQTASTDSIIVLNTRMTANTATRYGGGSVAVEDSRVVFANTVHDHNRVLNESSARGGAVFCFGSSSEVAFHSSTIVGNVSPAIGAVAVAPTCSVTMTNSLVSYNRSQDGIGLGYPLAGTNALIQYSVVSDSIGAGAEIGQGVLLSPPLFEEPSGSNGVAGDLDDDFTLRADSPGIDAGSNALLIADFFDLDADGDSVEALPVDLYNNGRVLPGATGGAVVDVGAVENTSNSSSAEVHRPVPEPDTCVLTSYPNPSTEFATVVLEAATQGIVRVRVFDLSGRLLVERRQIVVGSTPEPFVIDTSHFRSGVYFVMADAERTRTRCSQKVTVVN